MIVRFVPKQPGVYSGELMLVSALDVRIYELGGTATAPGLKAALEFISPARQPVRQDLPIVNNSDSDWSVQASLKAEDFLAICREILA